MKHTDDAHLLALTAGQQDLWVGHHLDPTECAYNLGGFLSLDGPLRVGLLRAALEEVIAETDALRTRFVATREGVRQQVSPEVRPEVRTLDLTGEEDPDGAARSWMRADLTRPVDVLSGPLTTFAILRIGPDRHCLYQRAHHLVLDAYAVMMISRRLAERYSALWDGGDGPGSAFGRLTDLVAEDELYRCSARFERDRRYWSASMSEWGEPEAPDGYGAPVGGAIATTRNSAGALDPEASDRLVRLARGARIPWWTVVVAGTAAHCHRLSGKSDLILIVPVHGRTTPTARRTPGALANLLPIRLDVRPTTTLAELSLQTSRVVSGALRHQRYRFEDIRRDLGHRRDPGGWWPVVNILDFDYTLAFGPVRARSHPLSVGASYDLSYSVYGRLNGSALRIDLDANAVRYPEPLLRARHAEHLRHLTALLADPEKPLARL